MARLDEIGQQRERLSGRLAKLDEERAKLAEQLNELEIAERVLARFGGAATGGVRRRGRRAKAAAATPAKPAGKRTAPRRARTRVHRGGPGQELSLSDAALKAIGAHPQGIVANELLEYLAKEYGMTVRPNHLGIALQRHRRAGRLESRDSRWFRPAAGGAAAFDAASD